MSVMMMDCFLITEPQRRYKINRRLAARHVYGRISSLFRKKLMFQVPASASLNLLGQPVRKSLNSTTVLLGHRPVDQENNRRPGHIG